MTVEVKLGVDAELEAAQQEWEKTHSPRQINAPSSYPGWQPSEARKQSDGSPTVFSNGRSGRWTSPVTTASSMRRA